MLGFYSPLTADEVVLDRNNRGETRLGDYHCSPYRIGSSNIFELLNEETASGNQTEFTAGELWSFFHSQGLVSVDRLVICVDCDRLAPDQFLGLESFELLIEDPSSDTYLRQYTLGNNSLVLPGDETNSLRAECRLEVALGYDFMQRYSKSSQEKVKLNFAVDSSSTGAAPTLFIEGRPQLFTVPSLLLLGLFCGFWIAVFWVLRKLTLPTPKQPTTPKVRTAMSLPRPRVAHPEPVAYYAPAKADSV